MSYAVESFLSKCDDVDIEVIIEHLMDSGYLPKALKQRLNASAGEIYFEQALDKIHGKWNQLSEEEEDFIMKLSERFVE